MTTGRINQIVHKRQTKYAAVATRHTDCLSRVASRNHRGRVRHTAYSGHVPTNVPPRRWVKAINHMPDSTVSTHDKLQHLTLKAAALESIPTGKTHGWRFFIHSATPARSKTVRNPRQYHTTQRARVENTNCHNS